MRRIILFTMLGALIALAGCGKEDAPEAAPKAGGASAGKAAPSAGAAAPDKSAPSPTAAADSDSEAVKEAKNIYKVRCTICHGENGKGDGPGAASLNPKPRDYSDKSWQASVDDEYLKKVLVEGGTSVGKSAIMPPNPDLGQKPEVLDAMIEIIRGFGK